MSMLLYYVCPFGVEPQVVDVHENIQLLIILSHSHAWIRYSRLPARQAVVVQSRSCWIRFYHTPLRAAER